MNIVWLKVLHGLAQSMEINQLMNLGSELVKGNNIIYPFNKAGPNR
jgi:hypothetical protein